MFYDKLLERVQKIRAGSEEHQLGKLNIELIDLNRSRVFLFDSEQAEVFMGRSYRFENYPRFVFPEFFINFTYPLEVPLQGTELTIHDNTKTIEPAVSQIAKYKGVMIGQTAFKKLPAGMKLQDVIGKTGEEIKEIIDSAGATEELTGGFSRWYEDFPQHGDVYLDSHTIIFDPESFPDLANRHVQEQLGSIRLAETLHNLAINLMYFLACENIQFTYRDPNNPETRKFMRSVGHSTRKPFYTIDFKRSGYRTKSHAEGEGYKHSFIYDVTGHVRHLRDQRYRRHPDGTYRTLWIHDHQRGLANDVYIPALRDTTKIPRAEPV